MSWASVVAARVRGLFRGNRLERELDDEVRLHLEMQIDDNLQAGMDPVEARHAALRSFGAIDPMKETYRERSAFAVVETTARDVRYAVRTLRRSLGFTTTCTVVLALAIGANTAMFSVLRAVLLRPLPYRSPEQLAMLWREVPSRNVREGRSAYATVEEWRTQSQSFADMAVFDGVSMILTSGGEAEHISGARISPNLFPLLGVQPLHGRIFSDEEAEQQQRLALISFRFWQSRFGGSMDAIGASIELDGRPSRIIGIIPAGFSSARLAAADVWEAHTLYTDWSTRLRAARGDGFWFVVGRLRPGVTFEQAQAEMSTIARRLDGQLPGSELNRNIAVVPLDRQLTGPKARLALWLLTAAVFCVLLVAATNVTGLQLARSAAREREIAVRAALGASRGRIVRQLLAESLTLAVISGLLGLLVAAGGIRLVLALQPGDLRRLDEVRLDPHVLGWALALCLVTGVLVGLAPAMTMARRNPKLHEAGRGVAGGGAARRIRRGLVVAELALAIVLLVGAGLLIRSLRSVQGIDPGFRPARVLSVGLTTSGSMPGAQCADFYARVLEHVQSLPGVESAGTIENFFITSAGERIFTIEESEGSVPERLLFRSDDVGGRFFEAAGTPLLRGRFFSLEDGPAAPPVAIVNDAMARRLWPGLDPVGRRFKLGPRSVQASWFTVVGVVADMRRQGLENEPIPQMFVALAQRPSRRQTLLVRTSADDPMTAAAAVRAAVHRVDKNALVSGAATLDSRLGAYLTQRRFQTSLLIGFSAIALLTAAIGIYGLIQYSVAARTREIGVRMAVGARAGAIFRMVIGDGLKLSLAGLVLGVVGALWLARTFSSLLFGVATTDPVTLAAVSLLLVAVAAAACYFPARRAMKLEPTVALRHE